MENAYLVRTPSGWYFINPDKYAYAGRKKSCNNHAGQLIGYVFDRNLFSGCTYENGEFHFSKIPSEIENMGEKSLDELVKLQAYLVLKTDEGYRVTDLVMERQKKRPSRRFKIDAKFL
jgi:hypothetical protein